MCTHTQPGLQNAIEAGCDVILHGANIGCAALKGMAAKALVYIPILFHTAFSAAHAMMGPETNRPIITVRSCSTGLPVCSPSLP